MKNLTIAAALLLTATLFAQTEKQKVEETITKSEIEGHIYFLTDDLLKGRATGTPENKIAASYLANVLRGYGVKPNPKTGTYYQPFELKQTSAPKIFKVNVNGKEYKNVMPVNATKIDYNKDAVYLGFGLVNDYKNQDVKGKVIILKAGESETSNAREAFLLQKTKMELAKTAGAIGIIEMLNVQNQIWDRFGHSFNDSKLEIIKDDSEENKFAYIWIQDADAKMANTMEGKKNVPVKVSMSANTVEMVKTQNVIGIIEGTDSKLKNEYIIYSGHYDHVGIGAPDETGDTIYNGARDNAVGVTTVLSMAENLAKYPTKRSAIFILFTGEEKGLLGSSYYVENPVLPLKQMVYCFNSDNAGYNDTSIATIIGLGRTTAEKNIKDAAVAFGLKAVDDPAPEQNLFDRSDNVYFAAKGIPAPTYSLGFTAFNGDVTKYYHQAGDEADTLDYEYLTKFFRSYVLAGRMIGNDPLTPVWVTGDTYEAASKELYGK